MVKNTYLAKCPLTGDLQVITAQEWIEIVKKNKTLPKEDRRYFMLDTIEDGAEIDRIYIEVTYAKFLKWNSEKTMHDRNRKDESSFKIYSLDAFVDANNYSFQAEALAEDGMMEERFLDHDFTKSLIEAVKSWEPWAYDMLRYYATGAKRSCTAVLAQKYGISEQAMRTRKKLFEAFCKNFFES